MIFPAWLTRWQQTPEDELLYEPLEPGAPCGPPAVRQSLPPGLSERDAWDYRCLQRLRHLRRTSGAQEQEELDAS